MHFAASLEILKNESSDGDNCFYSIWGGKTSYIERRALDFKSLLGMKSKSTGELILKANPKTVCTTELEFDGRWVDEKLMAFEPQIEKISTLEDLRKLEIADLNPSSALANEIVSLTKFRNADLSKVRIQIRKLLRSYLEVYNATYLFVEKNKIDKVHLYNGRFIHERAVWDCISAQKLEIVLFEVLRDRFLQRSAGFHDRIANQNVMISHWNNSKHNTEKKIEIGSKYFSELRSKSNPFSKKNSLPLTISKPYFVYFSNSDDEAVGFWNIWNEGLGEQVKCVEKLQEYFELQTDLLLVVRIHPNLLNKSTNAISYWKKITSKSNSLVIGPDEEVSSYELLDNSLGSISFGSTLSLESAFARIPSIVLADCAYDELGAIDKVSTWQDVYNWLETANKISNLELDRRRINSCIRGYYLETYGERFKNTRLLHLNWGSWLAIDFMGLKIGRKKKIHLFILLIYRIKQYRFTRSLERA